MVNRRDKRVDISLENNTDDELDHGRLDEDVDNLGPAHCLDYDDHQHRERVVPLPSTTDTEVTQYKLKKIREESGWEKSRERLQRAFVWQQYLPEGTPCCACGDHGRSPANEAVCRCCDCGWEQWLCLECATMLHNKRNMFHVLEIWKV